jgi:hypothetical protein
MVRVWVYTFVWNDEILMYYRAKHFEWAEKHIVYDNESTDKTVEVAKKFPNVEVRSYNTSGKCNDTSMIKIVNRVWREAKGKGVDWVIIGYLDEILYHPNLPQKLQELKEQNYTAIRGVNHWMVSENMPSGDRPITEQINTGIKQSTDGFDKAIAIVPDNFDETNYVEGMHRFMPLPEYGKPLKIYHNDDVKLLHYKYIGKERCRSRARLSRARLSLDNIRGGFAVSLLERDGKELDEYVFPEEFVKKATKVI